MFLRTAIAASLLAAGAHAGIGALVAEGLTRNSPSVERRLNEIAGAVLRSRGFLESRQSQGFDINTTSDVTFNPDGTINMTAWDEQATKACTAALSALPVASNPSGTCVCYNLPLLNNITGTFKADLRLFRISAPTGDFAGIAPQDIEVGLTYRGASVSSVSATTAAQMGSTGVGKRQDATVTTTTDTTANGTNPNLQHLQTYLFVGQIDADRMKNPLTMGELEALVMPVVTLSATSKNGGTPSVSTNVSSNEAAFVAGVFSQSIIMSDFNLANLAVMREVANMKNGTTAFVLPGIQILVFPVGLVVTATWLIAGLIAYGIGTYDRINFREQYKRRSARATKGPSGRI